MKKLLLVGDFACPTGFARVSENIAKNLKKYWDIDILAINYHGDYHPLQKEFKLYVPSLGGDVYGIKRIVGLCEVNKYDVILIINDIWIIDMYIQQLQKIDIPLVWYTPVDAKHIKSAFVEPLNLTAHGIAYTEFGKGEIIKGGLTIPIDVIPHGVDTSMFHFVPQKLARKETGIPEDWFIMLNVNRNQIRKRLDLAFYYFSEWVKRTNKPETVKIYYHGALQDIGYDIEDMAVEFGVDNRLVLTHRMMTMNSMLPVEKLKFVYNSADVFYTTCASEGWYLPLHEAMACAIPSFVPRSSALAEWPNGGVEYMEIIPDLPTLNTGGVNTIMDTPSLDSFIEGAEKLYNDVQYRRDLGLRGFKIATQPIYKWANIAERFNEILQRVVNEKNNKVSELKLDLSKKLNKQRIGK